MMPRGRRPKFQIGERVVGREEGRASFRCRFGVVVECGRGEYAVQFEDSGVTEWVMSSWIEAA
jgi:hypothetical protein